jgi:hypothetical protein
VLAIGGARSKTQAIKAAVDHFRHGIPSPPIYLNKRPRGFERVSIGQVYESKFYGPQGRLMKVDHVGASYVRGHWTKDPTHVFSVRAREFMRDFHLVQPASR